MDGPDEVRRSALTMKRQARRARAEARKAHALADALDETATSLVRLAGAMEEVTA